MKVFYLLPLSTKLLQDSLGIFNTFSILCEKPSTVEHRNPFCDRPLASMMSTLGPPESWAIGMTPTK